MIQTNIIEETIKKIKGIMESDYSFNFPNHSLIMDFRLKVNGQNLVLSINEINVDFSEIEEDDFKLKDYNYLTNFHKKIQVLRGTDIPVIVNFEEDTEWDGYINTPKLSLEDDEILEIPNQSISLESYLVDFFSDMGTSNCSIYGELTFSVDKKNRKNIIVDWHGFSSNIEESELIKILSGSEIINEELQKILAVCTDFPEILNVSVDEKTFIKKYSDFDEDSFVKSIKGTFKTLKENNYFSGFNKNAIIEDEYDYLWVTSDKREQNEAILGHHTQGFNFHWNNYPQRQKIEKLSNHIIHTYEDFSWLHSPACDRFSKQELNGRAIREIPSKNNNSEIKRNLYLLLKDSFKENKNIFNMNYSFGHLYFHLILSKDRLVEIKDLGNRNIIGLNKNNEIILFISGVEVKDIIEDKNKFINGINKLIL